MPIDVGDMFGEKTDGIINVELNGVNCRLSERVDFGIAMVADVHFGGIWNG